MSLHNKDQVYCPDVNCPWSLVVSWTADLLPWTTIRMDERKIEGRTQEHLETHLDPWILQWKEGD